MKHNILQAYTMEELAYEYYVHYEYDAAIQERIDKENVKIEKEQLAEAVDWADAMEAAEFGNKSEEEEGVEVDPTQDPDNIAWMEEQMQKAKEEYGQSFGEDISEDFT